MTSSTDKPRTDPADDQAGDEWPEAAAPAAPQTRRQWFITIFIPALILLIVGGLLGAAITATVNDNNRPSTAPAARPSASASPSASESDWRKQERAKPSYVGTLGDLADRKLALDTVYYARNTSVFTQTGDYRWFADADTILFLDPADAGEQHWNDPSTYPLQVKLVSYPWYRNYHRYMIKITLPSRPDFYWSSGESYGSSNWKKIMYRPSQSLNDQIAGLAPVVPIGEVNPAPGLTLADYYVDQSAPSALPVGQSGFIYLYDVKVVTGTNKGYVRNSYYLTELRPETASRYVKLTNTGSGGLIVCLLAKGPKPPAKPDQVNSDYRPLTTDLPVQVVNSC